MNVKIPLSMTAISPISHNSDERAGNSAFFRTMDILMPTGTSATVPVISGNSLRGQLRRVAVRKLLADSEMVTACLPPDLYHFLFSGGSVAKGDSKTALPVSQINALRAELPLIGLWGGAWGGTILPGALRVHWVMPICSETEHLTGVASETPAHTLLTTSFFTRRDDGEAEETDAKSAQMIFEAELLVAGAQLWGAVELERATDLEAAFFSTVLSEWLASPRLGGQLAKGMGIVRVEQPVNLPSPDAYGTHVANRREQMRDALRGMGAL